MSNQPTIEQTIIFITEAHEGQFDKSGLPYYLHPIAVMKRLGAGAPLSWKLAALLHDIIEDTPYNRSDLAVLGYEDDVLDIVDLLTISGDDTRSYDEKIDALIASENAGAIAVKYADMSENSDPARTVLLSPEEQVYFANRYHGPLQRLRDAQ